MDLGRESAWGKLGDSVGKSWHSLAAHSIDVAICFEALATLRPYRARLASALGRPITDADIQRLSYLALIHDIGKASPGFRFKVEDGKKVGHIRELLWLLMKAPDALSSRPVESIFSELYQATEATGDEIDNLIMATFAHHGSLVHPDDIGRHDAVWHPRSGYDAIKVMEGIADIGRIEFPAAFSEPSAEISPRLTHLFAGMLQLADWLGSDRRVFEFWDGERDHDRFEWSRTATAIALKQFGLDGRDHRDSRMQDRPGIEKTLGIQDLRPAQRGTMSADGNLIILEGETGSGKTEAALARFFELYDKGEVDSLYFALPTRVAASEIYGRVTKAIDRGFPGSKKPSVLLAVPGQVHVDGLKGIPQPDFSYSWEDGREHPEYWAAEHSKRFLAAAIAVGTIDQVLLGALRVKHTHMRFAASVRSLVVVDEVHASDTYMGEILDVWLENHLAAGGHALLLSATLGGTRRSKLLGTKTPSYAEAVSTPYPLLSTTAGPFPIEIGGRTKEVHFDVAHAMDDHEAVARMAIDAAAAGAKVLVIRNTVNAAVAVMRAVAGHQAGRALVWKVRSKPALHHSRFASGDRALLDSEVQGVLGRCAPPGGVIVIGTQTLEQSLDIDADLLITDLCPMDVLLQRLGRLHRFLDRTPITNFELAKAIVLAPTRKDFDALASSPANGLGWAHWGGVYPDLFVAMRTLRALEQSPVVRIPKDNRHLVEYALHPDALLETVQEFITDETWRKHYEAIRGVKTADAREGRNAGLRHDSPFAKVKFAGDERVATRLGEMDRIIPMGDVTGPFGTLLGDLKVPGYLAHEIGDSPAVKVSRRDDQGLEIRIDGSEFLYDTLGLRMKKKDSKKNP